MSPTPTQIALHRAHQERKARLWPAQLPQIIAPVQAEPTPEPAPPLVPEAPPAMAPRLRTYEFVHSVKAIAAITAEFYNRSLIDLLSSRRTASFVHARWVAIYLARTLTKHSLPEIGRRFGGRDHTTILHAVKSIEARLETDEQLRDEIDLIKARLNEAIGVKPLMTEVS